MNRAQKRQLTAYLHFRDKEMSIPSLIIFNWHVFALTLLAGSVTVVAVLLIGSPFLAWIFTAAYSAIFLRDLGQCIRWARIWPMTRGLLDWTRVEQLAKENGLAG